MNEPKLYPYRLEWEEGHGLKTDPDSLPINAPHDDVAYERLASAMGITLEQGRPTEEDFKKAGRKAFYRGLRQIFPPAPEHSHRRIIYHGLGDGFKAYIEGMPGCWAAGSSIYEAIGDLVMHHGDELKIAVIQK